MKLIDLEIHHKDKLAEPQTESVLTTLPRDIGIKSATNGNYWEIYSKTTE